MSDNDPLQFDVRDEKAPLRTLLSAYIHRHRLLFVIGVIAALVSPVASLVPIYLIETVIDGILLERTAVTLPLIPDTLIPDDQIAQLGLVTGFMLGFALIGAGTAWIGARSWGRFAQEIQHALRVDTFRDVQDRHIAFHEGEATGQLVSILGEDVDQLNRLLERHLAQGIEIGARFAGILVLLFVLHWQLALILCLTIPVLGGIARQFIRQLRPKHHAVRQHIGALTARIQNTLLHLPAIKAYGREEYELDRVRSASREVYNRRWDVVRTRAAFYPTMSTVNWLSFSVILLLGGYWILIGPPLWFAHPVELGTIVTFLLFSQQMTDPLVQGAQLVDEYYESRASARRILTVRNGPTDGSELGMERSVDVVEGDLSATDLRFDYDDHQETILQEISVDVPAGTHVGIVGPTGSGKTTFIKLLLGYYEPDSGHVCLDGRDIATIDRTTLRAHFGVVLQDPMVFAGSIRDNIAYGSEAPTTEEVVGAAQAADLHGFISSLPEAYDTPVGERGVTLSGGQRQRIALARALLADPPILILDEATSQVDLETEAAIRRAIRQIDSTVISIAHRLPSISDADRILVFEGGRIVERGTHEMLLDEDGTYARLWRIQTGEMLAKV